MKTHLLRPLFAAWLGVLLLLLPAPPARAQTGCTSVACVNAGPRLASVDTTQSILLNTLLQALLPSTSVNLTVGDWNGLAGADINLNALITQLGADLSISDPSQVLDTAITLGQFQAAAVTVLQADGQAAAANVLQILPINVPGLIGTIKLGDLLKLSLPPGSLATIDLDLLDLITGAVQLYNFKNVVTTPTPITINTAALGLTGVANLQLWLQIVEPPVYVCGGVGASFHSAAVRVKLNLDLVSGLDLNALANVLNEVNIPLPLGGSLGVSDAAVQASVLKLQVYADIARAEGTVSAVNLVSSAISLDAHPGLVNLYIGQIADAVFFNRSTVITAAIVQPLTLADLSVSVQLNALIPIARIDLPVVVRIKSVAQGTPALQNKSLTPPYPKTWELACGTSCLGDLVSSLLTNLTISLVGGNPTITLLGALSLDVPAGTIVNTLLGALQPVVNAAVSGLLSPVLSTVLGLVDNVLGTLGIGIGKAVFTVDGAANACAAVVTLEKALSPTTAQGLFNLSISQASTVLASTTDVGHGGKTGALVTTPGGTYAMAETAGIGANLAAFATTWSCTDQVNTQVSSGSGTSFNFTSPGLASAPVAITCRITNRLLQSNVSISKSDGATTYTPGGSTSYVITVTNSGPDGVSGAQISDTLPNGMTLSGAWSCVAVSGSCSAASGGVVGGQSVSLSVDLQASGTATVTVPVNLSVDPAAYQ